MEILKKNPVIRKTHSVPFFPKGKKGISPVIGITLLLLVTVTAAVSMNVWFDNYSQMMQEKKMQKNVFNDHSFDILGIKNESGIVNMYLKNNINAYKQIEKLEINENECTLVNTNIIENNRINIIPIDCSLYLDINEINIQIDGNVFTKTISLSDKLYE